MSEMSGKFKSNPTKTNKYDGDKYIFFQGGGVKIFLRVGKKNSAS